MRLKDYDERDGMRVWLSETDVADLINEAEFAEQRLAFLLGTRSGLRRNEIVSVTPNDFTHAPDGFLRVWADYAKGDKYREVPIPDETTHLVQSLSYEVEPDKPIVGTEHGTTVYRWVRRAAERRQAATDDEGWSFLDVHDLRRTWGNNLLWEQGVLPSVVMNWGGWNDWKTFRDHYLGEMSPEAAKRERAKIDYIGAAHNADGEGVEEPAFEPPMATGASSWSR